MQFYLIFAKNIAMKEQKSQKRMQEKLNNSSPAHVGKLLKKIAKKYFG